MPRGVITSGCIIEERIISNHVSLLSRRASILYIQHILLDEKLNLYMMGWEKYINQRPINESIKPLVITQRGSDDEENKLRH